MAMGRCVSACSGKASVSVRLSPKGGYQMGSGLNNSVTRSRR